MVVTSLILANPPSTLVYKLRDFTIDSPTSMYHGSDSIYESECTIYKREEPRILPAQRKNLTNLDMEDKITHTHLIANHTFDSVEYTLDSITKQQISYKHNILF